MTPYEVFSALVAHELRTPLAACIGYLELLEDERLVKDPETMRHGLAIARFSSPTSSDGSPVTPI